MATFDLTTTSEAELVKFCEEKHMLGRKTIEVERLAGLLALSTDALALATVDQNDCLAQLVTDGGGVAPAAGVAITIVKDEFGEPTQLSW
jgi:hypothetical protein